MSVGKEDRERSLHMPKPPSGHVWMKTWGKDRQQPTMAGTADVYMMLTIGQHC
jgi:hypothetical protein